MNAKELWDKLCKDKNIDKKTKFESWQFGENPNELAELVMRRIKTATASAYDLYKYDNEPFPQVGDYSVILDNKNQAVCIIRTTKLYVKQFNKVTEEHAFKEGEKDRTLLSWRAIHRKFFGEEYKNYPIKFTEESNVLCEEFTLEYCIDD